MIIINRKSTNPYFNIAAEEFLIKTLEEPCFMLWQNTSSIIVGKHQNPWREVNMAFLLANNIPVIRRISGGGTVYQDLGNLNYSFIDMGETESLVNFPKYSRPILDLLQKLKVDAQLEGKSDLKIDGKKFSGNASHVYKNKILHHGTLLFNSDLNLLNESIKIGKTYITDKAVSSNRSEVTNISDHLTEPISLLDFKKKLLQHIEMIFPEAKIISLTVDQELQIEKLANDKYKSWEWNYGYSPKYDLFSQVIINGETVEFKIHVAKGIIQSISTNEVIDTNLGMAIQKMIGKPYQEEVLRVTLFDEFPVHVLNLLKRILFK